MSEQDQMSIKLVNKGWGGVVNDNMCDDNDEDVPCPALVIAGTTQVSGRHDDRVTNRQRGSNISIRFHVDVEISSTAILSTQNIIA